MTSGVDLRGCERTREQPESAARVGEHGENQRLKIVFAVIHVAEGRVVRAGEHGLGFAQRAAGQDADVLQRHRIALLRHDAGGLHERID